MTLLPLPEMQKRQEMHPSRTCRTSFVHNFYSNLRNSIVVQDKAVANLALKLHGSEFDGRAIRVFRATDDSRKQKQQKDCVRIRKWQLQYLCALRLYGSVRTITTSKIGTLRLEVWRRLRTNVVG